MGIIQCKAELNIFYCFVSGATVKHTGNKDGAQIAALAFPLLESGLKTDLAF